MVSSAPLALLLIAGCRGLSVVGPPAATAPPAGAESVEAEVARLRSELARLKSQIAETQAQTTEPPRPVERAPEPPQPVELPTEPPRPVHRARPARSVDQAAPWQPRQSDDMWQEVQNGRLEVSEAYRAEEKARKAHEEALEAANRMDTNLSIRQLDALDRRAQAETEREFMKEEKLEAVTDAMHAEFEAGIKEVTQFRKQEQARDERALSVFNRKMDKLQREYENEGGKDVLRSARHDQRQEREEAHEDAIAAKEWRRISKQEVSSQAREKVQQKKLAEQEAETSMRLWEQAGVLRDAAVAAAANGSLPQDEVLRLLDITQDQLDNMTGTLAHLSEGNETGSWFEERLRGVRFKSAAASAHLLEAVKLRVGELKSHHQDFNDAQLMLRIARLLNDTKAEVKLLQEESSAIEKRIAKWSRADPEQLTYAMSVALHGVTANVEFRNHLFNIDMTALSHADKAQACKMLDSVFFDHMQPAYKSLARMREKLDSLAKVVPSVVLNMSYATQIMADRTRDLVNMHYAQHIALRESAYSVLTGAAPVIAERLHCSFSGSPRAALGLAAAALAAAAALGQLAL